MNSRDSSAAFGVLSPRVWLALLILLCLVGTAGLTASFMMSASNTTMHLFLAGCVAVTFVKTINQYRRLNR